jgi:endonuclease/exonuclease/phosphatase (EEP) superfamily protein YafD
MKKYLRSKLSFWAMIEATGALLCVFTVTAFLGRFSWMFDLTAHFRIQYAVGLAALAAVCLVRRRCCWGVVFSAFLAANLALVIPYCCFGSEPVGQRRTALRAMVINVHTENRSFGLVEKFIREQNPDLVLLMEVNDEWMETLAPLKTIYPHICQESREDNTGIALFSKLPLRNFETLYLGSWGAPTLTAEIEINGRPIRIVGTHPPPPVGSENTLSRNQQLSEVAAQIRKWQGSIVLLGDLNTTVWSDSFSQLVSESGLRDTGRGQGIQATFPAKHLPLRIAIDHCLVSGDLHVVSRKVGADVGSDHLPVMIELATE